MSVPRSQHTLSSSLPDADCNAHAALRRCAYYFEHSTFLASLFHTTFRMRQCRVAANPGIFSSLCSLFSNPILNLINARKIFLASFSRFVCLETFLGFDIAGLVSRRSWFTLYPAANHSANCGVLPFEEAQNTAV